MRLAEYSVSLCILMAKKRKNNRGVNRRNFIAIPYNATLPLLTLGDGVVIKVDLLSSVLGEDIFVISIDHLTTIRNKTSGETPLIFGFCHSDLTVSEIAEALDAEVTDPDDLIARERAKRPVRKAGAFVSNLLTDEGVGDGLVQRQRIKFSVGDGHNVSLWLRNMSGAALTTGATLGQLGTIYGRWQR